MNETPTNEALAAQAKAGDREALAALWEQNRGLLRVMFNRLAAAYRERMEAAGVTLEDLEQEGYFAVAKAAKLYDPSAGTKFSTFLFYPVKTAFACAVGLRTERQRQEPLCRCDSLDAPLDAEDNGSATRGDTVPDAAAEQAFNDADECLYTAQLHSALDDALALLDERQATVLRGRFYEGRTLEKSGRAAWHIPRTCPANRIKSHSCNALSTNPAQAGSVPGKYPLRRRIPRHRLYSLERARQHRRTYCRAHRSPHRALYSRCLYSGYDEDLPMQPRGGVAALPGA